MEISAQRYEEIAVEEAFHRCELHDGRLREKPWTSESHNVVQSRLVYRLTVQLDVDVYDLRANLTRLRCDERYYYIPDLAVITVPGSRSLALCSGRLEVFREPLPLVGEVWSPSIGTYDDDERLSRYIQRGDQEVWRLHPFEYTLTAWGRQSDGTYVKSVHRSGMIEPVALPGVIIDIDALFA